MRILFCKWNGCAEAGIEAAFRRMGYEVDSLVYPFEGSDYSQECLILLQQHLDAHAYSFVFSQNFIPLVSKVCQIYKCKYISWIMDSPAYHLYSYAIRNTYNYIFIFDKCLYEQFKNENAGHIFYYPLATCFYEWEEILQHAKPEKRYVSDVSFLGSMYVTEAYYDEVEGLPEYIKGYMDGLIEAQLNVYGYNFLEDVLSDEMAEAYARYADWMQAEDYSRNVKDVVASVYLGKKCSQLERFRVANALADSEWNFKLYTNSPVTGKLTAVNQGVVGYYDEMPLVFRNSRINLNITSKSIRSGLPLRMFDIMGCGGFLLTNYQSEIPDYFEIGKDLVVYESIPHMMEQVAYYLSHEEERMQIARNGYDKIKSNFTYDIALAAMLRQILHK